MNDKNDPFSEDCKCKDEYNKNDPFAECICDDLFDIESVEVSYKED